MKNVDKFYLSISVAPNNQLITRRFGSSHTG